MEVRVREPWPDVARGFAIITVIFFHVVLALDEIGNVDGKVFVLIHVFAPIPMALFFFVSGLFSKKLVEGGWNAALGYRVVDLYYVFILWSVIEVTVRTFLSGELGNFDIVRYLINPVSNLWFVWALGLFTIMSALCFRRYSNLLLIISAILSLLSFTNLVVLENLVHNHVLKYAVFFFFGSTVVKLSDISRLDNLVIFACLSCIYASITFGLAGKFSDQLNGLVFALLTLIAVPTAVSGCYFLGNISAIRLIIGWMGKNSLGLYLGHPIGIMLLIAGYHRIIPIDAGPALGSTFILALLTLTFSVGLLTIASVCGLRALYQAPRSIIQRLTMQIARLSATVR